MVMTKKKSAGKSPKPTPRPGWRKRAKVSKEDHHIVEIVRKALLARRGNWPELVEKHRLNYRWLVSFARGDIDSPGIILFKKLANAVGFEVVPVPYLPEKNATEAIVVAPADAKVAQKNATTPTQQ